MAFVASLWLPILVSAVAVFIASFITHMVLPYHRSDFKKLSVDKEDALLDTLRRLDVAPGEYAAPHAGGPAGMRDPAFVAKVTKGPRVFMTLAPGAPPAMGPYLGMWFVYCLVVSAISAYIVWRVLGEGASFMAVCKLGAAVTFLSYAMALPQLSIWYHRSWATTLKSAFDSLIYAAVTGACLGYLWPK
jgi:hypothetical protein